ncbi:serine/threonine-protein kinase [Hyalangium rubrum]|uniref:Serine/threonine-protein kinase n=1 Tax=Hyalangium rubrum TaxID=3103134 RepID=A0ABU5GXJ9_9BACT|nr:serine/threonine-protein kinase [Hyalangium sp. s54d21]MDY7225607.1 serine/threonine-protein kinase [Hyalangium sp. s54d21]
MDPSSSKPKDHPSESEAGASERSDKTAFMGSPAPVPQDSLSPTNLRPDAKSPEQWWAPPKSEPALEGGSAPTPPPTDPLIGAVVGSFRLVRKLGGGGMGTVYLGEHTVIGSKVAVKFLHEHFASNEALVQRFLAEARAVNMIGHENIINIFDMNVVPPRRHYLVMEYLEGSPLSSMTGSPQTPAVVVPILTQVCDALQAAHVNGVVHRDLKPENIFLVRHDRTPHFVKVLDFGIAKLFDGSQPNGQTSLGTIIGTPEYMAPEQWSGKVSDGRTDLYALGIIAYELLTGRTPFAKGGLGSLLHAHLQEMPAAPHEANPSVPVVLSQVVMRAMAKRPEDRFRSASEMRTALEQALIARPPPPQPPVRPSTQMRAVQPASGGASDTMMGSAPTAPAPARASGAIMAIGVIARVTLSPGAEPVRLACTDLSRAGVFLCTDNTLPPLRARLPLTLELSNRNLPCTGEVVRHVTPAQAASWGMRAGFAVQFVELSTEVRDVLNRMAQGQNPPPAAPKAAQDDPQAEALLAMLLQRMNSDPYVMLSLPQNATFDDIRQHARAAMTALDTIAARPLSARQAKDLGEMRSRVEKAAETLGQPRQRIEHDAWRGNYAGVARCMASGMTATEIEALRVRFVQAHPGAETKERIHATTASAWESQGKWELALSEYEKALTANPLNLSLQQRYWTLKQRGAKPTPPPNGPKDGRRPPGRS